MEVFLQCSCGQVSRLRRSFSGQPNRLSFFTGNTTPKDLEEWSRADDPTYVADSVGTLLTGVPAGIIEQAMLAPGKVRDEVKHARGEIRVQA